MEENLQLMAKKAWRLIIFMLKKSISKTKFLADLNIIMKRGKIAGKAFHTIFFHHNTTTFHRSPHHLSFPPSPTSDSEFSCTTTPSHPFSTHKKNNSPLDSAWVKQLRITDSPFPLSNDDGDGLVDEAAEKFITRFYNDLRAQN